MEFRFEMALAAHLEATTEWVVARQLGAAVSNPGGRIIDLCGVRPGGEFEKRQAITGETIPPLAIESDAGVGEATAIGNAFGCGIERATDVVDRAVDCGFFECERENGRRLVRQTTRYPDWIDSVVGIENKPDLETPGALESQLQFDISLGLFDEVILATESYVTRAHLNRIPDAVGVWRFDPDGERTVIREPTTLGVDESGIEPGAEKPLSTEITVVQPAAKRQQRRRIAERAYGKGWRSEELPACAHATTTADGRPYCEWFERVINPAADCGAECAFHEPAEPPQIDVDAIRDERSSWVADPDGVERTQSGLDQYQ